ncbi:hypothetical protein TREMEDRAFT_59752 [Tremella mesenterica DSM 1558]|uniref:uncharacterized protein n=1 Tax=Tremella mesenterica (strain ATCC 24925 / CBS 8224 / DSM 1558 / NBRC 9311 / NRRL Y-6157 / RJB 2259-6 / UBC 559-6) TaxID=578456 RepID=UPI0003F49C1B|nr:uncharacterized protein TREMEDRAFT_59752 [Tremella mesenterica DSM 1558]EIW73578.1 hypothetical protein TREMEDRAFT_59752 [Tremella mesenterica DSM 1558]
MSLVGRFEHLPNRPKSDAARPLLEKIASQVKPIMLKRGWKVGTLAEFTPADPSLLGNNTNKGERINLRLRPPGSPSSFYEFDQLVLVMLHELTHNEFGPHDASFYKLLGELEEEFYELKRKGYTGEGFHSSGHHLSGLRVNEYQGRLKGLTAAQKRLDTQRRIGKGGVLGGSRVLGKSMKEIMAEAAERRIRDDKACNTSDEGHAKEVEEEVRKAQNESVGIDAQDLPGNDDTAGDKHGDMSRSRSRSPSIELIDGPRPPLVSKSNKKNGTGVTSLKKNVSPPQHSQPPITAKRITSLVKIPAERTKPKEWSCATCTLLNPASKTRCEACDTARPVDPSEGWYCEFCGAGPRDAGYWSCLECGWVRKWG